MKELNQIQTKLVAPKNQNNNFGGYKYRSLEDICEAVKPLLRETGCTLTFSDDLCYIGDRYYVKSTATITNPQGESFSATSFAREQESKKGMDEAQITGSASSYARKYAVCSLLAIDDNREPDMCDNTEEGQQPKKPVQATREVSTGLKKGQTITREMVVSGKANSLISKLAEFVGTPELKEKAASIREYYKWDSIETFNLICTEAQQPTLQGLMDRYSIKMANKA